MNKNLFRKPQFILFIHSLVILKDTCIYQDGSTINQPTIHEGFGLLVYPSFSKMVAKRKLLRVTHARNSGYNRSICTWESSHRVSDQYNRECSISFYTTRLYMHKPQLFSFWRVWIFIISTTLINFRITSPKSLTDQHNHVNKCTRMFIHHFVLTFPLLPHASAW